MLDGEMGEMVSISMPLAIWMEGSWRTVECVGAVLGLNARPGAVERIDVCVGFESAFLSTPFLSMSVRGDIAYDGVFGVVGLREHGVDGTRQGERICGFG